MDLKSPLTHFQPTKFYNFLEGLFEVLAMTNHFMTTSAYGGHYFFHYYKTCHYLIYYALWVLIKNHPVNVCQCKRCRFNPWDGTIPWRRKRKPTPVFLLRKSHGQRSLVGYSPRVAKSQIWLSNYTTWLFTTHDYPWIPMVNELPSTCIIPTNFLKLVIILLNAFCFHTYIFPSINEE